MILKLRLADFYINFLNILVDINKEGKSAIFIKDNQLVCTTALNNRSIYFYNTYQPLEIIEPVDRFNINHQKLKVALACIENSQEILLNVENNKLSYSDGNLKFDIRLLTNSIVEVPAFNIDTFNALTYTFSSTLKRDDLNKLKNADAFCSDTNKVYIRIEDKKLVITFGDKQTQQNNEMRIVLDNEFEGMCEESVYDAAIFRLLFKEKRDITMKINDKVLVFETNTDNSKQVYITTKLKK